MNGALTIGLAFAVAALGARIPADSQRGEQLFTSLSCIQCHSLNGKGGTAAPDLGKVVDRNYNPSTLVATMWNHAPAMWASMRSAGIALPDLNDQGAADLFAFFYSARFFERPADAGRGKRLFTEKHCADCHGPRSNLPETKPISEWESASSPVALVTAMWNHAGAMRQEFSRRKIAWPELTGQDLADILIYVRHVPGSRAPLARLQITAGPEGEQLFTQKGCAACHNTQPPLVDRMRGKTLNDIGVDLWNHSSKMGANPPNFTAAEMDDLLSYLWAGQFFQDSSKASAGRKVFAQKQCAGCHENGQSGAPKLPISGRSFSSATMVSVLWHHGPRMEERMRANHTSWPLFSGPEMAELIAFLDSEEKKTP